MNQILKNELAQAIAERDAAEKKIESLQKLIHEDEIRAYNKTLAEKLTIYLDDVIWFHYFPDFIVTDDTPKISKENCYSYFQEDIKSILRQFDPGDVKKYIDTQIKKECSPAVAKIIYDHLNWGKLMRITDIRLDFASALRNAKHGSDLSSMLDYSFSDEDISELAKLHKANKFRKKIEDLLTDCNFHSECSLMMAHQYESLIK